MNYLDLYLQRNKIKRYDVHKKTGISQQLLSTHKYKSIEKYSTKVILALSQTLEKTPGQVLDELIELEKNTPNFEAFNPQDLLLGLKENYPTIVIKGAYCKEINKVIKNNTRDPLLPFPEPMTFIFLELIPYAIQSVKDLFSGNDKINIDIEKNLINYKAKEICEDYIILEINKIEY